MSLRPLPLLAAALLALPALASSPAPLHEALVPQYPGAKPTSTVRPDGSDDAEGEAGMPNVKARSVRAFTVEAPVEEVVRFYLKRLDTLPGRNEGQDPQELKPGTASRVDAGLNFHDPQDDDDGAGHVLVTAGRKWDVLKACRPAWGPRQWVNDANFSWAVKQKDGSVSTFWLNVEDAGIAERWRSCAKRTRIIVGAEHTKSPERMEEEEEQADQAQLEAAMKAVAKAPTEKELGVPLYPGARYDVRNSAGMSLGEQRAFIFVSDDAPEKVLRFYEQKLGKKAGGDAQYGWMFALEGSLPVPQEGLTVQKNMLPGGGKTAITVMRDKE